MSSVWPWAVVLTDFAALSMAVGENVQKKTSMATASSSGGLALCSGQAAVWLMVKQV